MVTKEHESGAGQVVRVFPSATLCERSSVRYLERVEVLFRCRLLRPFAKGERAGGEGLGSESTCVPLVSQCETGVAAARQRRPTKFGSADLPVRRNLPINGKHTSTLGSLLGSTAKQRQRDFLQESYLTLTISSGAMGC